MKMRTWALGPATALALLLPTQCANIPQPVEPGDTVVLFGVELSNAQAEFISGGVDGTLDATNLPGSTCHFTNQMPIHFDIHTGFKEQNSDGYLTLHGWEYKIALEKDCGAVTFSWHVTYVAKDGEALRCYIREYGTNTYYDDDIVQAHTGGGHRTLVLSRTCITTITT